MLEIFKEVVKVDPDDLVPRKRLAKHFLDANNMAEAERYARMALEIVHCGNGKMALHALRRAQDAKAAHRIIIGINESLALD